MSKKSLETRNFDQNFVLKKLFQKLEIFTKFSPKFCFKKPYFKQNVEKNV